jgi:hypothetical protein
MLREFDVDPDDNRPSAKFARVLNLAAILPDEAKAYITEDTPLRDILPSGWPTVGDLTALVRESYIFVDEK